MAQVLEILQSLGIDSTVYAQFLILFIAYISMQFIVFNPYLKAYGERLHRTVGGQEEAEELLSEAGEQEDRFKELAKNLNGKIRSIFADTNGKAKTEVDQILGQAKKEADEKAATSRKALEDSVNQARKEMEEHIPTLSKNIENKFARQ